MEYAEKLDCSSGTVILKISPARLNNFAYTLIIEKTELTNPTGTITISRSAPHCNNFVPVLDDDGVGMIITLGESKIYEIPIEPDSGAGIIERVKCELNVTGGKLDIRLMGS